MEPRRRRIRATYKQLNLLVKFMRDNPNLVKGVNYRTAFGKHYHDAKWMELANLLNVQNGMNKSPREWNRYWKDLKCSIKKKVQLMRKTNGRSKVFLSTIEQIIYNDMCNIKRKKNTVAEEKDCSYLQIPTESDNEQDKYEVEYLEDLSCDEAVMTNIKNSEAADFTVTMRDGALNGIESESMDRNDQAQKFLEGDHYLLDSILDGTISTTEYKVDAEDKTVINNHKNSDNSSNTNANDDKPDILTDIRNHLKELVAVQKGRAESEFRLASAQERRAILEEKRVRIEERRLKMEEKRVALEERKIEALEKRTFAKERLASAAERRNEIAEQRMTNEYTMY